jgi:hypothetical protein
VDDVPSSSPFTVSFYLEDGGEPAASPVASVSGVVPSVFDRGSTVSLETQDPP